jgi:hypothetical protein
MNARTLLVVCCAFLAISAFAPSAAYGQSCSAATIEGSYAATVSFFAWQGTANAPQRVGSSVPINFAGRFVFTATSDSDGTYTGSVKGSAGGIPVAFPLEGTYQVDTDCTGTMAESDGSVVRAIAIANGGAEIDFSFTRGTEPRTGGGVMKRQ